MRGWAITFAVLAVLLAAVVAIGAFTLQRMRARGYEWHWAWEDDAAGGGDGVEPGDPPGDDGHDHDDAHFALRTIFAGDEEVMHVIYLNREGAVLHAGKDDARANHSSIVAAAGKDELTAPPYRGTPAQWDAIGACLRRHFEPFDVTVTDMRPPGQRYVMLMVGGDPALVGEKKTVSGLAPWSGAVIEDGVVFAFSRKMRERPDAVCDTAAMEIAHTYGLDHEMLCSDPMSYASGCGPRTFRDQDAPCGESKARNCASGKPTQNSYRALLAVLGPRKGTAASK
ncbi:MAG TPA: hypothetical protein VG389_14625 [Myxococcota bacterium]|jgi:hypothetical protein|nr:hypothetical protein [Myxococcota bacterium]